MANPTVQMLMKNISKFKSVYITGVFPQHFKQFLRNFSAKILSEFCIVFVPSLA
jgi:hypothetical protein